MISPPSYPAQELAQQPGDPFESVQDRVSGAVTVVVMRAFQGLPRSSQRLTHPYFA